MFLIVYDIQDDRLRARFAKYLKRYGIRVQFSVFQIENSQRILENIQVEIKNTFEKEFGQADSVLIYQIPDQACVAKFGYPIDDETDFVLR